MDATTLRMMMGASASKRVGQQAWTTPGTYTFEVPMGVTSISAVCIGGSDSGGGGSSVRGGDGGYGAALRHIRDLAVTPGELLTVVVAAGGAQPTLGSTGSQVGGTSEIKRGTTQLLFAGRSSTGSAIGKVGGATIGGGNGGAPTSGWASSSESGNGGSGGGAGGYSGNGGNAGTNGTAATGGAAGGGHSNNLGTKVTGVGGGGVGLLGEGASGANGTTSVREGRGGSDGAAGSNQSGGLFGGGSGGDGSTSAGTYGNAGRNGAVRIIWGFGRAYPSTRTGDEFP